MRLAISCRLPFRDECFDTVLLLDVLEHIQQPDSAMAEVRRVIKIGGRIVVQVPFLYPLHDEPYDFQRWTTHGLGAIFSRHGIEICETTWHGRPGETAAALLAIALAKGVLDAARKRHFSLLLAPLMLTGHSCGKCYRLANGTTHSRFRVYATWLPGGRDAD